VPTVPELNLYALAILLALLVDFCLERTSDLLNLRSLRKAPPRDLADLYDPETYRRSQEYTRARTRLGVVSASVSLAVLLGFWAAGGFGALDRWLRGLDWLRGLGLDGWGTVELGLVYLGVLALGAGALSLPFAAYSTFVIEERFGFNRTTVGTFVVDLVKGLVLSAIVGAPLLASVLWLFDRLDHLAWLVCWAVASVYTLTVQWLGPRVLLPLFNRFEPLAEGPLREAVIGYARSEGYALDGVTVMDASRRSSKANAFFTGFGRTKRLTLFDTLVDKLSVAEVVAVVAHEMGHFKRGHVARGIALGVAHQGAVLFLLSLVLGQPGLYRAFGVEGTPIYAGLLFFGLLMTPFERLLGLGLNAIMRRHELEADRYAAETTGRPDALISGLEKLTADHLSNLTPHRLHVILHHAHPPLERRIAALRRLTAPT